ncbi:MAG TPA: flagellar biosynthesis protein FlgL [Chloroflexota bacterium]
MTINSVGYGATPMGQAIANIKNQLQNLQSQLATGEKSTTYAGMGSNEGVAIAARAQLANMSAFGDTMSTVNTTIGAMNQALQSLSSTAQEVQTGAANIDQSLNSNGQSDAQQAAQGALASELGIINTQSGNRYLFSGSAITTPSVVDEDTLLNGTATQAGLKQVIAERQQADVGTGTGRLVLTSPAPAGPPTSFTLAEDVAGSPFGLKLAGVTSTLTGATVTGPSGSPATISVDLGGANPNNGDAITVTFNLPDGTTQSLTLTASTATPPPSGSFAIGATSTVTAANLEAALNTGIGTIANTSLVAASAVQAANDFFGSPPQRVSGTPLSSATALVAGTSANTVSWYTGDAGSVPARATATARGDQSVTVQYGARASEPAIASQLKTIALFAAFTTSPTGANAGAQISALSQRVAQNLTSQPGQQTIEQMQTEFASAQQTMQDAQSRQTQAQTMLQTMVNNTETVSTDQVASQLLQLQTNRQASYQATSMMSELTLTKYLPVPSG